MSTPAPGELVLTQNPDVFVWVASSQWAATTTYVWNGTGWFPVPAAA